MSKLRTIPLTSPLLLVIVHHSASADAGMHIEGLIAERKRRNEGYNFIVDDEDGPTNHKARVAQDAPDEEVSNGAFGVNWRSWHICIDGNFDERPPTPDEVDALVTAIATKTKRWGWKKVDATGGAGRLSRIMGHRQAGMEYSQPAYVTACPGKYLIAMLPEIRRRVAAHLPD